MDNLPLEIIIEILSKLPIKSIIRCRCVCKYWLKLTHDPSLVERHLCLSSQDEATVNLILSSSVPIQSSYCHNRLSLIVNDANSLYNCSNINLSLPNLRNYQVVGSCNGLICLFDPCVKFLTHMLNPCTGEYISLPNPWRRTMEIPVDVMVGFGFSPTSNEYKVVEMVNYSINFGDNFRTEIHVYTLGEKSSWRYLGDAPTSIRGKDPSALFVNGALHWVSSGYDGSRLVDRIIAFDVDSEVLKMIPHPDFESRRLNYTLGVLRGCLSATNNKFQDYVEVWIMNEYGTKESWTRSFKIVCSEVGLLIGSVQPLFIQKNGEVLLLYGGIFLSYNPMRRHLREVKIAGVPLPRSFRAISHVGSLVSPSKLFHT